MPQAICQEVSKIYSPDDYRLAERPLEPSAPRHYYAECADCEKGFHSGEESVLWNGERLCFDCAAERARDELDTSTFRRMKDLLADVFGFTTEEVYVVG